MDGPAQQTEGTPPRAKRKRQPEDEEEGDEKEESNISTSERVWHGLNKVERLWRRDKTAWSIDDIHESNRVNSRLTTPFPMSESAVKRKAKRVMDPAAMQSTAYIQVSDNDMQAWQQKVQQSTKPQLTSRPLSCKPWLTDE